jgi:hypothetical protein
MVPDLTVSNSPISKRHRPFLVWRVKRDIPTEVVRVPLSGVRFRMEEDPPHSSARLFYLHAPGLTLVALGTACVPQRASPLHVPPFARNLG